MTPKSKGFYLTSVARDFKDRLRAHAVIAAHAEKWKMLTGKEHCAVAIIIWNAARFDVDSPTKFIVDSMQGIVYGNDRVVDKVSIARSFDDGETRVEIAVMRLEPAASDDRSPESSVAFASGVNRLPLEVVEAQLRGAL
jgi:hypothetical protein